MRTQPAYFTLKAHPEWQVSDLTFAFEKRADTATDLASRVFAVPSVRNPLETMIASRAVFDQWFVRRVLEFAR